MLRLILGRLALAIPVLFIICLATFLMFQAVGVDPTVRILGDGATPEARAQLRSEMGLDQHVLLQFWNWLTNALTGDLGNSYFNQRSVSGWLLERLPVTLSVAGGAIVLAIALGIPAGVIAARRQNGLLDRIITVSSTVLLAIPAFWLGLLLVLLFSVQLAWFPVVGYTPFATNPSRWALGLVLPWAALGFGAMAIIARQGRSSMIEAMESGYVRSFELRGIPGNRIVTRYALKNSLLPVIAAIVLQAQLAIGSGFIVEVVFAIPGLGALLLDAVVIGDLPVLQGAVVVVAVVVVIVNLAGDILYGLIDPKVRPS